MRENGLPFSILSFCPFVKYGPTLSITFVFCKAGMVIIPDPNNFPTPIDANPERALVADGATTFGAKLVATGINPRARPASAAKNHLFLLCAYICDFDISISASVPAAYAFLILLICVCVKKEESPLLVDCSKVLMLTKIYLYTHLLCLFCPSVIFIEYYLYEVICLYYIRILF